MTLSRNALGNLISRYAAVLRKCRLCNVFGSLQGAAARMAAVGGKALAAGLLGAAVMAGGETTTVAEPISFPDTKTVANEDSTDYTVNMGGQLYVTSGGNASGNNEAKPGGFITMDGGQVKVSKLDPEGILAMKGGTATLESFDYHAVAIVQGGTLNWGNATVSGSELAVSDTLDASGKFVGVGLSVAQINSLLGTDLDLPVPPSSLTTISTAVTAFAAEHASGYLGLGSSTTLSVAAGKTLTVGDLDAGGNVSAVGATITAGGTVTLRGGTSTINALTAQNLTITRGTHTVNTAPTITGALSVTTGALALGAASNLSTIPITLAGNGTVKTTAGTLTVGNVSGSGDIQGKDGVTLAGGLNASGVTVVAVSGNIDATAAGVANAKALAASGDINAGVQDITAGTISAGGTVTAADIEAGTLAANGLTASGNVMVNRSVNLSGASTVVGDVTLNNATGSLGDLTANSVDIEGGSLTAGDITITGSYLALTSGSLSVDTVTGDVGVGDGSLTVDTITGDAGIEGSGSITAGTIDGDAGVLGSGRITADAITGDIAIYEGGSVAVTTPNMDADHQVVSGGLTIGSRDAAPLAEAMAATGKTAGLSIATPTSVTAGTISVGNATASGTGEVALGSDAVLNVNAKNVASGTPILKAAVLTITSGAALSISGAEGDQVVTAYEAGVVNGSFGDNVYTDNTLLSAAPDESGTATRGVYRISLNAAGSAMPGLDGELAALMDAAMRNRQIGTRDSFINAPLGGKRFLSRIISRDYGGADPEQAARTLESAARGAVVGAVPQMTLSASSAGANAVAGRMAASASGGGALTVSLNDAGVVGMAAGDETAAKRAGFAMWIMPLYQNWTGFGLEGGNYDMDVRGALGGVAIGADYTFENAIRAGITFNVGGGYAEGSGDFNSTANNMRFWGVGLYAGWLPGDFALTADVNFTSVQNSLTQELPAAMQMADLEADLSSWALSAGLRADYTFRTEWLNITPHAGVRFTHLKVNGYELESGGLTVLEGDAISQNIWSFPVGVTFARNFGTDSGWQVKPSLDLRVTPHAGDIKARGDVRFTGVGGSAGLETQTMDYVTYGGTAGLEFGKDNIKMALNYNLEAGAHSTQHGLFATFRYEF